MTVTASFTPHPEGLASARRLEGFSSAVCSRCSYCERPSIRALRRSSATVLAVKCFLVAMVFVSQDGVEDCEEFAGRSDGDEHFGLAGVDEALAKALRPGCDAGSELARARSATLRPPLSCLALPWPTADAASPARLAIFLLSARRAPAFGDEGAGRDWPHAGNGASRSSCRAIRAIRARKRRSPHQSRLAPSRARRSGWLCSF